MTFVSAVMVTHDGGRHLLEQVRSIIDQTRPIDEIVLIDDHSRDGSVRPALEVLRDAVEIVRTDVASESGHRTLFGRIGGNFAQAIAQVSPDSDYVVFADQDDVWHPTRVERHLERFDTRADALVSAADAEVIDDDGELTGQMLWESFSVPTAWDEWSSDAQFRHILHASVATGAAMAARTSFLRDAGAPRAEWLHDRWYSIAAASRGALDLDPQPVIRYRVHANQSAGLAHNTSGAGAVKLLFGKPRTIVERVQAVRGLRAGAIPEVMPELTLRAITRSMMGRARA